MKKLIQIILVIIILSIGLASCEPYYNYTPSGTHRESISGNGTIINDSTIVYQNRDINK